MLTSFLLFFHLGFSAQADIPRPAKTSRYQFNIDSTYFRSDSNYSAGGGTYSSIPDPYSNFTVDIGAAYDFSRQWRAYGRLEQSQVKFNGNSNSGLSEGTVGAQYWWRLGHLRVIPQVEFTYPFVRVDEDNSVPLIGEGATAIEGGGWLQGKWHNLTPYAYLGFRYRDAGRAILLPYKAGLKLAFQQPGFWLLGELRGFRTLIEDSETGNRESRDIFLSETAGRSYRYYSINPSLFEGAAQLGWATSENFEVYAGAAQTINGASQAFGWTATVGFLIGGGGSAPTNSIIPQTDEEFSVPQPSYEQELFRENSVVAEPRSQRTRRQVKKKKRPPPVSVDKMIQDTERSLERRK